MSDPKITESELHAYLDGELPRAREAEVAAYIASSPELAERLGAYRQNDQALRAHFDPVMDEAVPARLAPRRHPGLRWLMRYAAVACWVGLGAIGGWFLHRSTGAEHAPHAPGWAIRAAVAHAVYSPEVRHPVEVGADQEEHLIAWLSKRLAAPVRIPKLNALGYSLVGGRLLPGEQGPAAQFMYQDGQGQRLTLYVRNNRDARAETAFRFAQDGNVRVFYWIDRGLGLALSGEIPKDELLRVANAAYQQLNP